jgi:hypothetical protein
MHGRPTEVLRWRHVVDCEWPGWRDADAMLTRAVDRRLWTCSTGPPWTGSKGYAPFWSGPSASIGRLWSHAGEAAGGTLIGNKGEVGVAGGRGKGRHVGPTCRWPREGEGGERGAGGPVGPEAGSWATAGRKGEGNGPRVDRFGFFFSFKSFSNFFQTFLNQIVFTKFSNFFTTILRLLKPHHNQNSCISTWCTNTWLILIIKCCLI